MPEPTPPSVDFFGIGGIRCASTWFATCLDEHPDIFIAEGKEPNVFVPHLDMFERIPERHYLDWDWYSSRFDGAQAGQVLGDFSVKLLHNGSIAAPLIHSYYPAARFLLLLRDPVRRAYSHYWHHRNGRHGHTVPPTFRAAMGHDAFQRHSRYHDQLLPWLSVFPRNRFHVIVDREIRERPDDVIARAYAFLGVDDSFRPPSLRRRLNRPTSRRGVARQVARITKPLRRLGLGPALDLASRMGARRLQDRLDRRLVDVPPIDPADEAFFRETLRPDIEALERMLGLDLSPWKETGSA